MARKKKYNGFLVPRGTISTGRGYTDCPAWVRASKRRLARLERASSRSRQISRTAANLIKKWNDQRGTSELKSATAVVEVTPPPRVPLPDLATLECNQVREPLIKVDQPVKTVDISKSVPKK